MCYIIVTSRTLLWTLLTLATTLAMVAAVITPTWLIGPARRLSSRHSSHRGRTEDLLIPTLGVYNGCIKLHNFDQLFTDNCAPFVTSFRMPSDDFPNFWKAALVLFACGLGLVALTVVTSVSCCCLRTSVRKCVFTISGTVQAIAGLLFIVGLVLYPAGWGSKRVQIICGSRSEPYYLGDCTLGWTFYLAAVSTIVTFICALLSIQAEVSTSSGKVQNRILEGKNIICLL